MTDWSAGRLNDKSDNVVRLLLYIPGTAEHFPNWGDWLASDFNWGGGGGGEETLLLVSLSFFRNIGGGGGAKAPQTPWLHRPCILSWQHLALWSKLISQVLNEQGTGNEYLKANCQRKEHSNISLFTKFECYGVKRKDVVHFLKICNLESFVWLEGHLSLQSLLSSLVWAIVKDPPPTIDLPFLQITLKCHNMNKSWVLFSM